MRFAFLRIITLIFILYSLSISSATAQALDQPRIDMLPDSPEINELSIDEPVASWEPYQPPAESGEGSLWLRLRLSPEAETSHLFLYPEPRSYEIYQDGRMIYQSASTQISDPRTSRLLAWNIVPLKETSERPEVYIKLEGRAPFIMITDTEANLFGKMLRLDAVNLILVIAFTVISGFALLLYLINRQVRLLLFYSMYLFVHFALLLSGTQLLSKQLMFDLPPLAFFYWYFIGSFLDFTLLLLLFRQLLPARYGQLVLKLTLIYGTIGALSTALVTLYPPSYSLVMTIAGLISLIGVRLLILVLSVVALRKQSNTELMIFSIGFAAFVALDLLMSIAMQLVHIPWVYALKMLQPLAIVLPGVIILVRRYRQAERKAKDYSDALQRLTEKLQEDNILLEERVSERTTELEKVHHLLVEHVQEQAAAELEVAALAERNRIAQEIHDIVGHTLTTTIVQIEAGRLLVHKSPELTREKLELAQSLVRKGLEEIRSSVRLLREAEWSYDLEGALEKLIQETEEGTGIKVYREILTLPELSMEQKNILYLAMREGLTNGIKHGESRTFHLKLTYEEPLVIFHLKNNGKPLEGTGYGFGLRAMERRVEEAGGWLKLANDEEWNVIIDIRLPV